MVKRKVKIKTKVEKLNEIDELLRRLNQARSHLNNRLEILTREQRAIEYDLNTLDSTRTHLVLESEVLRRSRK